MATEKLKVLAKTVFPYYQDPQYYSYYETLKYKLMELKDSRIKKLASQLDKDDPIVMCTVGARYGLTSGLAYYLRHKKLLFAIGFEPEREEAQRLKDTNSFDVVLPYSIKYLLLN